MVDDIPIAEVPTVTRWRVDFHVKSDLVLKTDEPRLVFRAPDGSHEIQMSTRRGPGAHAADELYLSAHVILEAEDPMGATERGAEYLQAFLNVLAVASSSYYRIDRRVMVADWSPGLRERRFLYFKKFPNPQVPVYSLGRDLIQSVEKLMGAEIPAPVMLASRWWAKGLSASPTWDQFQYFWFALEILSEHLKPTTLVPDRCPNCRGELFCRACDKIPTHRPYQKQAILDLVLKHVTGQPEEAFARWDKARNALLHGADPKEIERSIGMGWEELMNGLGSAVWAALATALVNLAKTRATERETLSLLQANTYAHYEAVFTTDAVMGASHRDPMDPQIDEFQPELQLNLDVRDRPSKDAPTEMG